MRTQEFTIVPRNGGMGGEGKKKKDSVICVIISVVIQQYHR